MRQHSVARRVLRGRSRGQALVEFALVAPLFFIIFFSTIEFALIMASVGSFNFAARDGARLGSLLGRTDATSDTLVINVIKGHVLGLVIAKATEIDIYRATSNGQCLNGSGTIVTVDDASCVKDQYMIGSVNFAVTSSSVLWPVNARNDSLQGADYLGTRILYTYSYLTGFIAGFGTPLNLSAISVQRIEPQDFQGRKAGPPVESGSGNALAELHLASAPRWLSLLVQPVAYLTARRGAQW